MNHALIGARVKVIVGPAHGHVGVVTAGKTLPDRGNTTTGEYRIVFEPPVHVAAAGHVAALWLRVGDFEVAAQGESAAKKSPPSDETQRA